MSVCRRGHRGIFWDIFCQGKVYPGVWLEMECRDGIDRRDKEIWENRIDWCFCGNYCAKYIESKRK